MKNTFKKSDLRSGMMVEFGKGFKEKSLVLINTVEDGGVTCNLKPGNNYTGGYRHFNYFSLNHYTEDLREINSNLITGDIVAVYGMYGNLIWERSAIAAPKYAKIIKKCDGNVDCWSNFAQGKIVKVKSLIVTDDVNHCALDVINPKDPYTTHYIQFGEWEAATEEEYNEQFQRRFKCTTTLHMSKTNEITFTRGFIYSEAKEHPRRRNELTLIDDQNIEHGVHGEWLKYFEEFK